MSDEKPRWAQTVDSCNRMTIGIDRRRAQAEASRCEEEDSGGARCTADAQPSHGHRYRVEDLPDA